MCSLEFTLTVDKVIIDQASLNEFINKLHPGAYQSLTKVNFNSLDEHLVKPVGVYGSKSEIVKFLRALDIVDDVV